jgi:exosome complex RNA-binding protein Csl4
MKKFLILIFASLWITACGNLAGKAPGGGEAKLKVGDTVVFKLSRGNYGEGKIEAIDGSRYKIPYGTTSPTVDESDVYQLPKGDASSSLKAGDLVIAKQGNENSWVPAEVTSADGKALAVKTISYKQTMNLSPAQVIVARPAAIEEFRKLKIETAFDEKVASMRPTLPAGRVPKKGDRVVAAWSGNSWWAGTIVGQNGEKMMIKWGDSSRDSEVDVSRIGLYPAVGSTGTPFKSGDILLVKPTTTSSIWTFAEATSGREVRFKDDTTRAVRGDEYILFN